MKKDPKKALELFLYFFKIGWFTFGGGWSIVAQIQKDYCEDKHELEPQELLDIVSVGRSVPGTMIGNVAYLFGYQKAGVLGGLASLLGIVTPPMVILSLLTFCYTNVRDNVYVARALIGVRAVVAPVILSAVLKLHKGAFPMPVCYAICIAACLLAWLLDFSSIYIVLIGILCGIVLGFVSRGKGEDKA